MQVTSFTPNYCVFSAVNCRAHHLHFTVLTFKQSDFRWSQIQKKCKVVVMWVCKVSCVYFQTPQATFLHWRWGHLFTSLLSFLHLILTHAPHFLTPLLMSLCKYLLIALLEVFVLTWFLLWHARLSAAVNWLLYLKHINSLIKCFDLYHIQFILIELWHLVSDSAL